MTVLNVGGQAVVVDEEDLCLVGSCRWAVYKFTRERSDNAIFYVCAKGDESTVYMHRLIMGAGPGEEVDHRNGDGLDNRRSNLRKTTHRLNLANQRPQVGRSSRYKGVSFYRRDNNWEAAIKVNGRKRSLGRYVSEEAAARSYDTAAIEAWGEFARPNFQVGE